MWAGKSVNCVANSLGDLKRWNASANTAHALQLIKLEIPAHHCLSNVMLFVGFTISHDIFDLSFSFLQATQVLTSAWAQLPTVYRPPVQMKVWNVTERPPLSLLAVAAVVWKQVKAALSNKCFMMVVLANTSSNSCKTTESNLNFTCDMHCYSRKLNSGKF